MNDSQKTTTPLIQNDAAYDVLKRIAMVWLPALGTLYFALSQIWGLPAGGEVVGTITAIDTFMGVVLHISNTQYQNSDERFDGHIVVTGDGQAALNVDSSAIMDKDELQVKVTKQT